MCLCQSASSICNQNRALRVFEAGRSRAMGGDLQSCPALKLPLGGPDPPNPPGRHCLSMEWASRPHLALESRVLRLQPLAAVSARISAASALRDDPPIVETLL